MTTQVFPLRQCNIKALVSGTPESITLWKALLNFGAMEIREVKAPLPWITMMHSALRYKGFKNVMQHCNAKTCNQHEEGEALSLTQMKPSCRKDDLQKFMLFYDNICFYSSDKLFLKAIWSMHLLLFLNQVVLWRNLLRNRSYKLH